MDKNKGDDSELFNLNSWKSPEDDSNEPDTEYNDHVAAEDSKTNARFDDALLNSGYLKPASSKSARKSFKEQWNSVDELCPACGKVCKPAIGLTKQNIKKLFSFQTDAQSLTILFLFIMCAAFAFTAYTYMTTPINCSAMNITYMPENNIDPDLEGIYSGKLIIYENESSLKNNTYNTDV